MFYLPIRKYLDRRDFDVHFLDPVSTSEGYLRDTLAQ